MAKKTRVLLIAAVILVLLALIFRDHIVDFLYRLIPPEPYLFD